MAKRGLTRLDSLFIDEYFCNGFNGSQAYLTIFTKHKPKENITKNNCKYHAYRLLNKTEVKIEVQKRWDEIKETNIIRREEVLIELKETYFTAIKEENHLLLLKTIDIINKMCGNYTLFVDANINTNINLIIPGMEIDATEIEDPEEE